MHNLGVFFSSPGAFEYPFSKPEYFAAYFELFETAHNLGENFYIVRNQDSYEGDGWFSRSWSFQNKNLIETGRVRLDALYNKGRFQADSTLPVFNHPEIAEICTDKWKMYHAFTKYCPRTLRLQKYQELQDQIDSFKTQRLVFKPQTGAEGKGVVIESKEFLKEHSQTLEFPAVIQDFLDTSGGVPGIMTGMHDLRLALFDGEILYSYLRTPPKGSLLANVSQGGEFVMIDPAILPKDAHEMVHDIDRKFLHLKHRFYSVDIGYTPDGPKIIEMNSELGLLPNSDAEVFRELKFRIITALQDEASQKNN